MPALPVEPLTAEAVPPPVAALAVEPLPAEALPPPVPALPIAPLTVEAVAPPIPADVLGYLRSGFSGSRPAMLVALGVFSIFIGLLSLAGSASAAWFFRYAALHSTPPPPAPLPPTLPAVDVAPFSTHPPRAGGVSVLTRNSRLRSMNFQGPFADDRRAMVDELMAESGEAVGGYYKSEEVDPATTQSADAIWDPTVFRGPRGVIRVDNTAAIFEPQDGSANVVVNGPRVIRDGGLWWSMALIDQRVAELRKKLPAVTNLQAGRVVQLLDGPIAATSAPQNQKSTTRNPIVLPLSNAAMYKETALSITVNNVQQLILPDGRSVPAAQVGWGLDVDRGAPTPPPTPVYRPYLFGPVRGMWNLFYTSLAGGVLALGLIAIGLLTCGSWRGGGTWHLRWAGLKLILFVIESAMLVWYLARSAGTLGLLPVQNFVGGNVGLSVGAAEVIGLIYPIIVIGLLLNSVSIRQHYSTLGIDLPVLGAGERRWIARPMLRAVLIAIVGLTAVFAIWNIVLGLKLGLMNGQTAAGVTHVAAGGVMFMLALIVGRRLLAAHRDRSAA